ncbi:MAG: hypothetical protein IJN71_06205, partial [Oscillospiraceae bacterium]|nr:hypothetical protein [Oscillospiraceae bacterium]
ATAYARYDGNGYNTFNYWMKDGEIVSFDKTYEFFAYETCDLVAVYKKYEPTAAIKNSFRKALLKGIGGNQLMAEFIGFGAAKEKGIEIAGNRYSMSTDGSQFTLYNDIKNSSAKAYVIDASGNIYYSDSVDAQ